MSRRSIQKEGVVVELASQVRPKLRQGFTLIELVTVVGMVSLVMTSLAVAISSLHRVNRKLRDEYPAAAAVAKLCSQLRLDVHGARQAELVTDAGRPLLRLTRPDQRIVEYGMKQDRASRIVRLEDQIERQEYFLLARGSELEWTLDSDSSPFVTLRIRCHAGRAPGASDDVRTRVVVAAVGLDHTVRP
jgi:prepilin-type N-terminal cleavage/methylation domain-containing protein